jgi:type III secretory pathway component EscV
MQNHNRIMIGAIAVAVVLALLGVPIATLVLMAVLLACPLMMFFMMRDGHGQNRDRDDAHAGHER